MYLIECSTMQFKIIGDNMQALLFSLSQGEQVYAQAGSLLYYRGDINMDSATLGGLLKSISRNIFTGENLFMSVFTCQSAGELALAAPYPGKIIHIPLQGQEFIASKGSYLCSIGQIDVSVTVVKKLRAGLFGGQGFILQKISGYGDVFLHSGGNFVEINLVPGEVLMLDTGCLVLMEASVDYSVEYVGKLKNYFFGGEGMFLAKLTGPGKVIVETLPFYRLIGLIASVRVA
ncbi:MAG: TIGR00266 family protein [Candidatus Dojkabacteria bacterium]|nr:MAG: TIGR00266 family protein [Candidatus Dojkabacteria bacterium]